MPLKSIYCYGHQHHLVKIKSSLAQGEKISAFSMTVFLLGQKKAIYKIILKNEKYIILAFTVNIILPPIILNYKRFFNTTQIFKLNVTMRNYILNLTPRYNF